MKVTDNPTWLPVVAAAMIDGGGRVLMHRRPPGKAHAGLWEFPGGKVEAHEIPVNALIREISEELAIALDPGAIRPAAFAQSGPGESDIPIVILLYTATVWLGVPHSTEGGDCGWFDLADVARLEMPPLDVRLHAMLVRVLAG
jgi:8-oxo-dGTP diphosphatase